MQGAVSIRCPNCAGISYIQVTGGIQNITCPHCSFQGTVDTSAAALQASTQASPSGKSRSKSVVIAVVIVLILIIASFIFIFALSPGDEDGELEIIRVYHEPSSPGTDDIVDFFVEIANCPSSKYEVVYHVDVYNGSTLTSYGSGNMYTVFGSKDTWGHSEDLTSTGFNSGYEIRFWVEVFDKNRGPGEDLTPLLTSETDSFFIS